MTTWIALLRGINVGGHNVKMDVVRRSFEALGLERVRSYLASGNVFFDTEADDPAALAARIEERLGEDVGFAVPVLLRTDAELERTLGLDPFAGIDRTDDVRFCIYFADAPLPQGLALPIASSKGDMEIVGIDGREAFVRWWIVNGRPPSGSFPPGVLPERVTTRFFHTAAKILAAARRA